MSIHTGDYREGNGVKIIHRADKIRPDGAVSARCYKRPRQIPMQRASWTVVPELVTCKRCLAKQREPADG